MRPSQVIHPLHPNSLETNEFVEWAQHEKGAGWNELVGWFWGNDLDLIVCLHDLADHNLVSDLEEEGLSPDPKTITLFTDEWRDHKEACKTYIEARLGDTIEKIGARETKMVNVSPDKARGFLNRYHIQGANNLGIAFFGLEWRGELVGLMSLGRHGRQISADRIVLDRLCFKRGVQVIGGASKLLKAAADWARAERYNEILTYSDNRLTPGDTYAKLGFKKEQNLRPDYFYVDSEGERLSKQSQKKGSSRCPTSMTEFEWAKQRGLTRIYDAGKIRWTYNLHPNEHLTHQEKNSRNAARMHQAGVFKHSHLRGYFSSEKSKSSVYYSSSYELRALYLLEQASSVAHYGRCDTFRGAEKWRNPDLKVTFIDGHTEIWEVKPESQLELEAVQKQIRDSAEYAASIGVVFKVWSEKDSGLRGEHEIIQWGKRYHAQISGDTEFEERQKSQRKIRRQKYYERQPWTTVVCDYCQSKGKEETVHRVRQIAATKNIRQNGRYVCEVEGASKAGSRPKDHLHYVNPHATDGKKVCSVCAEVKSLDAFDVFSRHPSGRAPRCKECTSKYNKQAYEAKKKANGGALPKKEGPVVRRAVNPLASEGKKKCSACDLPKPLEEFNPKKDTYDGLKAFCKECDRKRDAAYKAKRSKKSANSDTTSE